MDTVYSEYSLKCVSNHTETRWHHGLQTRPVWLLACSLSSAGCPDSMTLGYVTGCPAYCWSPITFSAGNYSRTDLSITNPFLSAHLSPLIKIVDPLGICLKSADFSLKQIGNPSCFIFFWCPVRAPCCLLPKKLTVYILDSFSPSLVQYVLNTDISLKIRNRFMDTLKF